MSYIRKKTSFSYFAIVKYTRNSMQTVSLNKHLKTRLPMTLLFLFLLMVHVGTYTHPSNTRVFGRFDEIKYFMTFSNYMENLTGKYRENLTVAFLFVGYVQFYNFVVSVRRVSSSSWCFG